jgi:hypothetical protein
MHRAAHFVVFRRTEMRSKNAPETTKEEVPPRAHRTRKRFAR